MAVSDKAREDMKAEKVGLVDNKVPVSTTASSRMVVCRMVAPRTVAPRTVAP